MSDVHFFIDPNGIASQSGSQKFGPVNAAEYRVTSSFTVAGTPLAYAICRGRVLIQPQAGTPGIVNLILKPVDQPIEGLNIKYFVYRGLSEGDFFALVNSDKVIIAPSSGTSDFINKIRTEFTNFHNPDPEPPFLAKFIGYDPTRNGTDMLDDLFFKESDWDSTSDTQHFELPMIDKGKSLGKFSGANCGIDVVINYGDYTPAASELKFAFTLNYARAPYASIVPAGSDTEKKVVREQIYQFLDVAGFYGSFCASDSGVGYGLITNNATHTGSSIYTILLNIFATKNRFYLYLNSDRGRSYNFYGNYFIEDSTTDSLKIGIVSGTTTALSNASYATMGWPILIDEAVRPANSNHRIYLEFPLRSRLETFLYARTENVAEKDENNFVAGSDLIQDPGNSGSLDLYTKEVVITIENVGTSNIAGFAILYYFGAPYQYKVDTFINSQNVSEDVLESPSYVDDVFNLILGENSFKNEQDETYRSTVSLQYKPLLYTKDKKVFGLSMVQTALVEDTFLDVESSTVTERVLYIADLIDSLAVRDVPDPYSSDVSLTLPASAATDNSGEYKLPSPYFLQIESFTESYNTIQAPQLKTTDNSEPRKMLVGLIKSEHDLLKNLASNNSIKNSRLFFVDSYGKDSTLISAENTEYKKFKISVVGEDQDGVLQLLEPSTDVFVYTVDEKMYFSSGYSLTLTDETEDTLAVILTPTIQ